MSTPASPQPAHGNEIDLMDLSVRFARILYRHRIWVILFPLLGFFGGYINNLYKGAAYGGEMMLRTRVLSKEEITFLVENYRAAGYPGLSLNDKRLVRGLDIDAVKEEKFTYCRISCECTDTVVFRKLSTAMKTQIENEPSVRATTRNINDANTALINEYTATIRKAGLLLEQRDVDPAAAYKNYRHIPDLTLVYDKRMELEIARRDSTALVIVSDFKPQKLFIKSAKSTIVGLVIGIIATAVLIFMIHFVEHYRKTDEPAS